MELKCVIAAEVLCFGNMLLIAPLMELKLKRICEKSGINTLLIAPLMELKSEIPLRFSGSKSFF